MSWKHLRRRLGDFFCGGPLPPACHPLPDCLLTPIIFANGRDDDSEGLKAFYENRTFIFAGSLREPSDRPMVLRGWPLRVSASAVCFVRHGRIVREFGFPGRTLLIDISGSPQRHLEDCPISLNCRVEP